MNQLIINAPLDPAVAKAPRERLLRITRVAMSHLAAVTVIAAIVAAIVLSRLLATAVANRDVMGALREAFPRLVQAMGIGG